MGLKLCCDGCHCDLTPEASTRAGRLEEVCYCADCAATWDRAEADIDQLRIRLSQEFEEARTVQLAQAREKLRKLPDE